ncbi:MAG: hypothetical protein ChlgKO_04790 [Chlamydiales bacterium]
MLTMLPVQPLNIQEQATGAETCGNIDKLRKIETLSLTMIAMRRNDILPMKALFQRVENLTHYADGEPRDPEWTERRCLGWINRWKDGNPFSAMAIYTKSEVFVGYFVLGNGDNPDTGEENAPGFSEGALMLEHDYWNNGYCKEIMKAAQKQLIPELKKFDVNGAPLESVVFTTSPENQYMVRACDALDLKPWRTLEPNKGSNRWNKQKLIYWIHV